MLQVFILFAEVEEMDYKEIQLASLEVYYYCLWIELSSELIKSRTLHALWVEQEDEQVTQPQCHCLGSNLCCLDNIRYEGKTKYVNKVHMKQ